MRGLELYDQNESFTFLSYFWTRKILKKEFTFQLNFENIGLLKKHAFFKELGAPPKYKPIPTKFYKEYLYMR